MRTYFGNHPSNISYSFVLHTPIARAEAQGANNFSPRLRTRIRIPYTMRDPFFACFPHFIRGDHRIDSARIPALNRIIILNSIKLYTNILPHRVRTYKVSYNSLCGLLSPSICNILTSSPYTLHNSRNLARRALYKHKFRANFHPKKAFVRANFCVIREHPPSRRVAVVPRASWVACVHIESLLPNKRRRRRIGKKLEQRHLRNLQIVSARGKWEIESEKTDAFYESRSVTK